MIMPAPDRLVRRSARLMQRLGMSQHESLHVVEDVVYSAAWRAGDDRLLTHGWYHDLYLAAVQAVCRWHLAHPADQEDCSYARQTEHRPRSAGT